MNRTVFDALFFGRNYFRLLGGWLLYLSGDINIWIAADGCMTARVSWIRFYIIRFRLIVASKNKMPALRRQRQAPQRYDPGDNRRYNQNDIDRMRRQRRKKKEEIVKEEIKKVTTSRQVIINYIYILFKLF